MVTDRANLNHHSGGRLQRTLTRRDPVLYCLVQRGSVRSIILIEAISLVGVLLVDFQQVAELANFGVLAVFALVNCRVMIHCSIQGCERKKIPLKTNPLLPWTDAGIFIVIWLGRGAFYFALMIEGFSRPVMD